MPNLRTAPKEVLTQPGPSSDIRLGLHNVRLRGLRGRGFRLISRFAPKGKAHHVARLRRSKAGDEPWCVCPVARVIDIPQLVNAPARVPAGAGDSLEHNHKEGAEQATSSATEASRWGTLRRGHYRDTTFGFPCPINRLHRPSFSHKGRRAGAPRNEGIYATDTKNSAETCRRERR